MASAAQDARVMLRKESEWMAKQPRARQAKSKARIQSFHELTTKSLALPKVDLKVSAAVIIIKCFFFLFSIL